MLLFACMCVVVLVVVVFAVVIAPRRPGGLGVAKIFHLHRKPTTVS